MSPVKIVLLHIGTFLRLGRLLASYEPLEPLCFACLLINTCLICNSSTRLFIRFGYSATTATAGRTIVLGELSALGNNKVLCVLVHAEHPICQTISDARKWVASLKKPAAALASWKPALHMGRPCKHLESSDVHCHVCGVPNYQGANKGKPHCIEYRSHKDQQRPQFRPCRPFRDRDKCPECFATCPSRNNGINHEEAGGDIKAHERGKKHHNETIEGPLVA
mmetsp:Transcript_48756/g.97016  ORF Transcript_48756/g.97016 Transcript_48756/m.97016 type:complete len:222 (-) Transcript_48756:503-1168(-)